MKKLTLIAMAILLSACAHEKTTMDRELALKLADRPQVILANNPAPVVNVNNYIGGQQRQSYDQSAPARDEHDYSGQEWGGGTMDHPCINNPVTDAHGVTSIDHRCW